MIYIILVVCLVAIAAYYPIKLIKFYCMESKEQALKAKITQYLREGKVSRKLIFLVLGDGGLRLTRNQLDVIFEWMVQNTNAWNVRSDKGLIVMFRESPFRPDCWSSLEDYKHTMRQMFGEHRTKDFCEYRASMAEVFKIQRNLQALNVTEEPTRVRVFDYVQLIFDGTRVLAMVVDVNDNNEKLLTILSGTGKGQKRWVASTKVMEVIPKGAAISELSRLKKEWKEEKRKQSQEASQIEFQSKYGDISPGTYLRARNALYIVESVDMEDKMAKCVRLVDLGVGFPANQKCVLFLPNGFEIATPEEAAQILVKEYCNE